MRTIISVVTDANDRDGAIWGESRESDAPPYGETRLCEVRMSTFARGAEPSVETVVE